MTLSIIQTLDLTETPPLLAILESKQIHETLVKGPSQGVPALQLISQRLPQGRIFIWAPTDHNHLARLLSPYETAAAQGIQPVPLSLLILCESFPGITAPQLPFDLWKPVPMRERWQHLRESVELLQESDRCVVTGSIGPRTVTKPILAVTLSPSPSPLTSTSTSWRPAIITVTTGPIILVDGPADQLQLLQRAAANMSHRSSDGKDPCEVEAPPPWLRGSCSKPTSAQG